MYMLVLSLFHFGITALYGLKLIDDTAIYAAATWWYRPATSSAIIISSLGFLGCGLGIGLASLCSRSSIVSRFYPIAVRSPSRYIDERGIQVLGNVLLSGSVIGWFLVVVRSGGFSLLISSYDQYLAQTAAAGAIVGYIWLTMGMGLCFAVMSRSSPIRSFALALFALFAVFALPLGLRGEVLFSVAAAAAIWSRHRTMPSARVSILAVILILFGISFLREVRTVGIGQSTGQDFNPSVTSGLVELGGSIRPVAEVVQWHVEGDAYINGASYWAPVDRAICQLEHPIICTPAEDDERIMNVLIMHRLGPFGFSPIAEAYRNFGTLGVILIMAFIGAVLLWLDHWARSVYSQALASVIYVELLINIRNSFTPIPSHLILGGVLVMLAVTVSALTSGSHRERVRINVQGP